MKKTVFLALLFMAAFMVAGCHLEHVRRELKKGGFDLWYPAESGVEPGQIWVTNGKQKSIEQLCPDGLKTFGPGTVKFQTLSQKVDANVSLDTSFGEKTLGQAGELAVLLENATVKNVTLDFGKTYVTRLVGGSLRDPQIRKTLPEGYLEDLVKVRTKRDGYVLISDIVTSSGMTFTFTCEDTKKLEVKAPEISKLIKGEFDLDIKSDKTASWKIPETDVLTIGICFLSGEAVDKATDEVDISELDVENALLKLKGIPLERLILR